MTLHFTDADNVDHVLNAVYFMDGDSVDHTISQIKAGANTIYITGAAGSLTVDVAPTGVGATTNKTGHATTDPVVATPSGGTAPYTYAWTIEDALDGTPVINSPSADTTTFSIFGLGDGDFCTATARCTVIDANSFTNSGTCAVSFYGGF